MKILEKILARRKATLNTRPVVIACLGDSVTHGCFEVFINEQGRVDTACRASKAYPQLLSEELGKLYPFAQPSVINAGVSGDNARSGLRRMERDVLSFAPDLVIVDFGLNDSMNPDVEGGLSGYREAMREIMKKALDAGSECILLTPNFMCSYPSHNLKEETLIRIAQDASHVQNDGILARYVEAAKQEAESLNVPVADAYGVWQALSAAGADTTRMLSNDINHPTEDAHRIFVNVILKAMLKN